MNELVRGLVLLLRFFSLLDLMLTSIKIESKGTGVHGRTKVKKIFYAILILSLGSCSSHRKTLDDTKKQHLGHEKKKSTVQGISAATVDMLDPPSSFSSPRDLEGQQMSKVDSSEGIGTIAAPAIGMS